MVEVEKAGIIVVMPFNETEKGADYFNIIIMDGAPKLMRIIICDELGIDEVSAARWVRDMPIKCLKLIKIRKDLSERLLKRLKESGAETGITPYEGVGDIIQYF